MYPLEDGAKSSKWNRGRVGWLDALPALGEQ
jgi:hypothetical protein